MKKKVLFGLLLACFVFSVFCKDESIFRYEVNNGGITITGYHDITGHIGDLEIPEKINGLPVLEIAGGAFHYNVVTSVTIPDSVKIIRPGAFYANRLTKAIIGNSVETIGEDAFRGNLLTSIAIPNSVKSIGKSTFKENKLKNVVVPDSAKVEKNAFDNNVKITLRK